MSKARQGGGGKVFCHTFTDAMRHAAVTACLIILLAGVVYALPQGGTVAGGSATISKPSATTMQIKQNTDKAIINWQGYSIAGNEAVKYLQPGGGSIALNRVIGLDPSLIYGQLSANGQVWVINPNGLLVGPNASIQTGSFLGSTLNISDQNFLAGRYIFTGSPSSSLASIINQGNIVVSNGGYVALLSPSVTNEGTILANAGKVFLASGEEMTLNFAGNNLVNLVINKATQDALGIKNTGTITADGGQVVLTARTAFDILKNVVNNEGIIQARSIVEKDGKILLDGGDAGIVVNSGTLDASGLSSNLPLSERGTQGDLKGGSISLLGKYVGLFDSAKLDASGDAGGGTVLVGGNYQGKGPETNAFRTYVGKDVTINANAVTNGGGGKVIVWSDDATRFYGNISAKGGLLGGGGGFVEVSGKQNLTFAGQANLSAVKGKNGTLLLDPNDLYVGAVQGGATEDTESPFEATDGADHYVLAATFLPDANYIATANHDVIFNASVSAGSTSGKSVSITATNNINMAGFSLATAGGPITLNSSTMTLGGLNAGAGLLTINNSGAATQTVTKVIAGSGGMTKTGAGTLTLSGANTFTGGLAIKSGTVSGTTSANAFGAGTITLGDSAGSANATLNGGLVGTFANLISVAAGNTGVATITNSAASIFSGAVTLNNDLTLAPTLTNLLTLRGGMTGTGNLVINGSGTTAAVTLSTNTVNNTGTITNSGTNTGTTTISGGVGTNVTAITENSTTSALTVSGALTVNSAGTTLTNTAGTKLLTLSGGVSGPGNLVLKNDSAMGNGITLSTTAVNNAGTVTNSGAGAGSTLISSIIGTNVAGVVQNSGTSGLTLSGANTFTGLTTVSAGTLTLSGGAAIANTGALDLSTSGAALTLSTNETIGSLTGVTGTNVNLGANTLTTGGNNSTTEYAGVIGGTGGLTKTGTGTWTLSGTNTYTGATTATLGTLAAGSNAAFGGGTLVLNGGTVAASGVSRTLDNAVSLAASSTVGGASDLTFTNKLTNTFAGNPTLTINNSTTTTFGAIDLSNSATSRTLTVAGTGNAVVSGIIADGSTATASALTKTSTGTL
ncbi:MAG: filamentous hemagglutinin N-terminal domain-containing protein, partial [Proteobacteria bacterium]|nr:filamentous hemagglutinin N-terminal domain-containing protein [Pseudomonadota bacterium]